MYDLYKFFIHIFHKGIWPSTNMPASFSIYVPLNLYCSLHLDPTVLYTEVKKQQTTTLYLLCYCHICARNKYSTEMPHICHICQLLCVHIWEKYASIYTSYEFTATKTVTKSTGLCICSWKICLPHNIHMSHCTSTICVSIMGDEDYWHPSWVVFDVCASRDDWTIQSSHV